MKFDVAKARPFVRASRLHKQITLEKNIISQDGWCKNRTGRMNYFNEFS